jgi:hypothetical protein
MNTIRKTIADWLRKLSDAIDPKGGGGPIEPR